MTSAFSKLTPNAILDGVELFSQQVTGAVYPLNSYENRVFQVGTDSGSVIAKFYRPQRWSREQVQEEHAFSEYLRLNGLPVAKYYQAGVDTFASVNGFTCSVQEKLVGRAPELQDFESLFQLGQLMGKMHALSKEHIFAARPVFDPKSMGWDNLHYLQNIYFPSAMKTKLINEYDQVLTLVDQVLGDRFGSDFIAIHGDCHLSNILVGPSGAMLVDFDDCRMGPAVQDLWMLLSGDDTAQRMQLNEIIEGYEENCEFDRQQLSWIPALRALRVINYTAWLGKRWSDPAFPIAFPWFNSEDFWLQHMSAITELKVALKQSFD